MIVLDTHCAIWVANDDNSLGPKSRHELKKARYAGELGVSAVSFWEIALLAKKRRLALQRSLVRLRAELLESGVTELPLTGSIAILAVDLDLHSDPADRFIAATAIAHQATLMTADRALLRWPHALPRRNASV